MIKQIIRLFRYGIIALKDRVQRYTPTSIEAVRTFREADPENFDEEDWLVFLAIATIVLLVICSFISFCMAAILTILALFGQLV